MGEFHHLTFADRLKLEALLKAKVSKKEIANILKVHISTIYREIKKGSYVHLNHDWTTEERYSPDQAEDKYKKHLKNKGAGLKIDKDLKLMQDIEQTVIENAFSPATALSKINWTKYKTSICITTLYSYIDKGVYEKLSLDFLPVKRNKKTKKRKVKKQMRAAKGDSIEKRPEEVKDRKEFGHWEMDTVVGPREKSKKTMLVLTERKTRKEIIELLDAHTTECVRKSINRIERRYGASFKHIFKTITVDNGSEFADYQGIETARRGKGEKKRTKVYYCHPYSSYERGSNEVNNRFIRRKIPKGINFDDKTSNDIKKIERWINHYPRLFLDMLQQKICKS